MYAIMCKILHKSACAMQTLLGFTNSDLEVCGLVCLFACFSVLEGASKKCEAESAHNKGALVNAAIDTTLYSTTLITKALIPHC